MKRHEITGKRFLIFGAARSGLAAAKLLRTFDAKVTLLDQAPEEKVSAEARQLSNSGVATHWGGADELLLHDADIVILSPGIPVANQFVQAALARGIRVVSEIELASAFVPDASKLIAITGTNGKTTTTAWIGHILKTAGFDADLAGNIGLPFSEVMLEQPADPRRRVYVVEVSSFQLETIEDFHPDIALLTNLAPDHLDRYDSYDDYVAAKRNILRNMTARDAFIYNADNEDSGTFSSGSEVTKYSFSTREGGQGASAEDGMIKVQGEAVIGATVLPLPGLHNLENALAAALVARLAGASVESIRDGLKTFAGVEHRIELCGEINGVKFYNDSKATNVDSTEKALASFDVPIILIAGGKDKNSDYALLKDLVKSRVKKLVSLGQAAPLIESAWGELVSHERAADMADAVRRGFEAAAPGDVVLLSPACASYDMYNNFEERGRDFKAKVAELATAKLK